MLQEQRQKSPKSCDKGPTSILQRGPDKSLERIMQPPLRSVLRGQGTEGETLMIISWISGDHLVSQMDACE